MKKLITIVFALFCLNSLFALTLPGIGIYLYIED